MAILDINNKLTTKIIGRRIFIIRQAKKISREKLASKIGISHQQLYKYEMGKNRITVDRLIDIAKALDIKARDFFPSAKIKTKMNLTSSKKDYQLITNYSKLRQLSVDEVVIRFLEMMVR